jgi:hypothetical protein
MGNRKAIDYFLFSKPLFPSKEKIPEKPMSRDFEITSVRKPILGLKLGLFLRDRHRILLRYLSLSRFLIHLQTLISEFCSPFKL